MFIFLTVLMIASFVFLLIVASIQIRHSEFSMFELERRVLIGNDYAKKTLSREKHLGDILSLRQVIIGILLVIISLLSVVSFGWVWGILLAFFVAIEYGAIARFKLVKFFGQKLYKITEIPLLNLIDKVSFIFRLFYSEPSIYSKKYRLSSREELQNLIDESDNVLTAEEKRLVIHSLSFGGQLVSAVMTPRDQIHSIDKTEFLGPLALNDLHKLGHGGLPVINVDIDHIVGILNLNGLLALDIKRSVTAEKAMDPKVYYIREDQTLQEALAAFIKTHRHLFIVVNTTLKTVGLLSLSDVIEALIGQKIIDDFDVNDDLRAVTMRNNV